MANGKNLYITALTRSPVSDSDSASHNSCLSPPYVVPTTP